ncbi:hypothetical protein BCR26_06925 [Enterococcus rivorum]|uniref:OmpR/PhoB-type domain-containing protein n=2 Tax=Enterococcus rivorum TaxID=762845 RepID=A0A1E5KS89_9ENTE|nr:hypothetical protein BCR26_06925 [Enterococcus rivorum]
MHKVGYISLNNVWKDEYLTLFKTNAKYKVKQLDVKDIERFTKHKALLIEVQKTTELPYILQLLLEVKKIPGMLTFIVSSSEIIDKTTRTVCLHLGVNGIKDATTDTGEFSIILKNALDKLSVARNQFQEQQKKDGDIFELNPVNLSLYIDNNEISLTKLEYQMLELLYRNLKKTVSYEKIYEKIWNDNATGKKYRVANTIFHIRKKLEHNAKNSKCIETVRSKGYRLNI